MKTIFTLLVFTITFTVGHAQVMLNEVYPDPKSGNQEFFEFFNNTPASVSMDNYTLVTYFDEGGAKKGLYVMDLPNLSVAPKGYFVGSSARPLNYQGNTNSNASQFSWNDLVFMATNNAYVRKWQVGTTVPAAVDGNASYDLAAVPVNHNDFFNKVQNGSNYTVMVFNNGVLQSIFMGGISGGGSIPSFILTLPRLSVDMSGSAPDFQIDFASLTNAPTESVTQSVGSDNGYIRMRDGFCGTWDKSSSQVNHSPGVTNGGPAISFSTVSVESYITRGDALAGSTIHYNVVAAGATDFPVTMNVYLDNGTTFGQLDAADTYLGSKTESSVSDGGFSTTFFPYTSNIMIQTTTSAGCIDNVRFVSNTSVLAVKLLSFQGTKAGQATTLKWQTSENEQGKSFEIERSADGRNFSTIGTVNATPKAGTETYSFTDAGTTYGAYYRLRLVNKSAQSFYSTIVLVEEQPAGASALTLRQNPVESYLSFTYTASAGSVATINIYSIAGTRVYTQQANLTKGVNTITIAADGRIYTGTYIVEVSNRFESTRTKFIKR